MARAKTAATPAPEADIEAQLGDLINKLDENRKLRRPIEEKLKPLEEESSSLKVKIIALLDQKGLTKSGTAKATVSISDIERVVIKDAAAMVKALTKQGWLHILDLKVVASKEYLERTGKEIPGTVTEVVRRQLNHTSLK